MKTLENKSGDAQPFSALIPAGCVLLVSCMAGANQPHVACFALPQCAFYQPQFLPLLRISSIASLRYLTGSRVARVAKRVASVSSQAQNYTTGRTKRAAETSSLGDCRCSPNNSVYPMLIDHSLRCVRAVSESTMTSKYPGAPP